MIAGDFNVPFDVGGKYSLGLLDLLGTQKFRKILLGAIRGESYLNNVFANFDLDSFQKQIVNYYILYRLSYQVD